VKKGREEEKPRLALRMAVALVSTVVHLGGECARTDVIELQMRVAADLIPLADRARISESLRDLLDLAVEDGLLSVDETAVPSARLKITRLGMVLVGYAAMNGPIETAENIRAAGLEVFRQIAEKGIAGCPVDNRKPR
jgi:hypothetical protein